MEYSTAPDSIDRGALIIARRHPRQLRSGIPIEQENGLHTGILGRGAHSSAKKLEAFCWITRDPGKNARAIDFIPGVEASANYETRLLSAAGSNTS